MEWKEHRTENKEKRSEGLKQKKNKNGMTGKTYLISWNSALFWNPDYFGKDCSPIC